MDRHNPNLEKITLHSNQESIKDEPNAAVESIKQLFQAARYPNTSPHGTAPQLSIITSRDEHDRPLSEALIRTQRSSSTRYSCGFIGADGFEVIRYIRADGRDPMHRIGVNHVNFTEPFDWDGEHSSAKSVRQTMTVDDPQALFEELMTALTDEALNPKHGPNANAYVASQQPDTLLQA